MKIRLLRFSFAIPTKASHKTLIKLVNRVTMIYCLYIEYIALDV